MQQGFLYERKELRLNTGSEGDANRGRLASAASLKPQVGARVQGTQTCCSRRECVHG